MTHTTTNGGYCLTHSTYFASWADTETHIDANKPCTVISAARCV